MKISISLYSKVGTFFCEGQIQIDGINNLSHPTIQISHRYLDLEILSLIFGKWQSQYFILFSINSIAFSVFPFASYRKSFILTRE